MLTPNSVLQSRYLIVRKLGQGGMGTVYEAVDQRLSCLVALKETIVETPEMLRAFEREASLLANLRHPSLPKVIDHFLEGHGQFLVMEFIHGNDLAELLTMRARAFPTDEVLRWADILLQALTYLHSRQPPIIHRDIKPGNLKVTQSGEVFLIDFGLAKGAAGQMKTLDSSRSVIGYTPIYAPLEQINGTGTDPRSDLYALGATLYHLITGEPPSDSLSRVTAVMNGEPDPLQPANKINLLVSPEVAGVLGQAMSQSRNQRPATATIMRNALQEASKFPAAIKGGDEKTLLLPQPTVPSSSGADSTPRDTIPPTSASTDSPPVSDLETQPERQNVNSQNRSGDIPVATLSAGQMFSSSNAPIASRKSRTLPMSWMIVGAVVAVLIIGILGVALISVATDPGEQPGSPLPTPTPTATITPVTESTDNANNNSMPPPESDSNANTAVINSNSESGTNAAPLPTPSPKPVKPRRPRRRVEEEYN